MDQLCAAITRLFWVSIIGSVGVLGLGCNWGTQSTHHLPPNIVVELLKENGFDNVKLFEADPEVLVALANSGIQVMLGIPNESLVYLASNGDAADAWVYQNVSEYISKHRVDIRHVAVGNEPFLTTYNGTFDGLILPALQNIQAALTKAGLADQIKVTVPLNADVYQTNNGLPSGGNFRSDINDLMVSIMRLLTQFNGVLTINVYPFLSLYADPNFPTEYAFFDGASSPVVDGSISYTNVFDANLDTLISALERNGFPSMPVVVGEVGWPTDGDVHASMEYARRFNQGLMTRIVQGQGTPKRQKLDEIYLFSLLDEDAKSIQPGYFERHWGLLYNDGSIKYNLSVGNGRLFVPAKGVRHLARKWCIMSPNAPLTDPNLTDSIDYACSHADCTSLGNGSSCWSLDLKSKASYAFNTYYQAMDQSSDACLFSDLSVLTTMDPSQGTCKYQIMIYLGKQGDSDTSLGPAIERRKGFLWAIATGIVLMITDIRYF